MKRFNLYISKFVEIYKTSGIISVIMFLINKIITFRIIYKSDLNHCGPSFKSKELTMEQLNDSDLRLLYSVSGNEINIDRYNYLRQLLTGSSSNCYIVKNINGDICGYCAMWFGEGLYDQIFGRIKNLNINDNGYLFRDYTFKKFRGKGVQKFMIYSRLEILRNNGYKTATTRIAIGNYISERVYKKFGFIGNLIEIRFPLLNAFYTMSNLVLLIPID